MAKKENLKKEKEIKKLLSLYEESEHNRPVGNCMMARIGLFDPVERRQKKTGEKKVLEFPYGEYIIQVKRPELTLTHEKLLYTFLKISQRTKIMYKKDGVPDVFGEYFECDFYKLRKVAGLHKGYTSEVVKDLFADLGDVVIRVKEPLGKVSRTLKVSFGIIIHLSFKKTEPKERKTFGKLKMAGAIHQDMIDLINSTTNFTIPTKTLEIINNKIHNPFIYKAVMFYQTQSKKQKHEVVTLMRQLTGLDFDKYQRLKIRKAFKNEENIKILNEFGITVSTYKTDVFIEGKKLDEVYIGYKGKKKKVKSKENEDK